MPCLAARQLLQLQALPGRLPAPLLVPLLLVLPLTGAQLQEVLSQQVPVAARPPPPPPLPRPPQMRQMGHCPQPPAAWQLALHQQAGLQCPAQPRRGLLLQPRGLQAMLAPRHLGLLLPRRQLRWQQLWAGRVAAWRLLLWQQPGRLVGRWRATSRLPGRAERLPS
jgi:hypothetical protein